MSSRLSGNSRAVTTWPRAPLSWEHISGSVVSWRKGAQAPLALRDLGLSFWGWAELLSSEVVGSWEVEAGEAKGGGMEAGGTGMETWGAGVGTGAGAVGVEVGGAGKEARGARVEASTVVGTIPRGTQGLACEGQRSPWGLGTQMCGEGPEREGLST